MKTKLGLWIDHKKASIVSLTPRGEQLLVIQSKVEKQPGRIAGVRSSAPFEALQVPADDSRQRKLTGQFNVFYAAVIAAIREAGAILIFGPGEAKGELKKHLIKEGLGDRVVAMETVGRITDRQIVSKIRDYFRAHRGLEQKWQLAGQVGNKKPALHGPQTSLIQ